LHSAHAHQSFIREIKGRYCRRTALRKPAKARDNFTRSGVNTREVCLLLFNLFIFNKYNKTISLRKPARAGLAPAP
jgi:hypothetical protein